jgi:hypothetical protein
MKNYLKHFVLLLSIIGINIHFLVANAFAGGSIELIASAFQSGNAAAVADYFDANIEITILQKESTVSKNQAQAVLDDFFQKNKPIGFKLNHQGSSPDGSVFAIGSLSTSTCNYRIYYYLKSAGSKQLIQELRIEKE